MKITIFTSNSSRHNYLINLMSGVCDEIFIIQECGSLFKKGPKGKYPETKLMKKYFNSVNKAQKYVFGNQFVQLSKKAQILSLVQNEINNCSIDFLSNFLKSDLYIVCGSSWLKGKLAKFLIKNKAINIHMGISPFYRGSDCNFWALFEKKYNLIGATIHYISNELDQGPILYHAVAEPVSNHFLFTMAAVKSAYHSLYEKIKNKQIFDIKGTVQDKKLEIKYTTKKEFNDRILKKYYFMDINIKKNLDYSNLINPFFLGKESFSIVDKK